tara:strand:+ start:565 stop:993 length:429 start_codon:yes stop_codon:yes gene_type:complete
MPFAIPVSPANPRRVPLHPDITEALVDTLVRRFYERIRADETLGPIFARRIGDDWEPHLLRMTDFWSSVMRMTGRYKGKPVPAHMRVKDIRPEHFALWLDLFRQTASELCAPDVAALFITRAERIAESLKLALFFDTPPHPA